MIKAELDTSQWKAAIRKLNEVGKDKLHKTMTQSAKLVMRDIVKFTPPFGNAPITESFSEKKKIGEGAIARDIFKIFSQLTIGKKSRFGKRLHELINEDLAAARDLLNNAGIRCYEIRKDLDDHCKKIHRKARNKRGQVKWSESKGKVFILKKNAVKKYIKLKQKNVGTAMSGWAKGVKLLKASSRDVPAWARKTKPKTRGRAAMTKKDKFPDWKFIAANQVGYAKELGVRPVERAIKNQTRNLLKRVEAAIKHSAKKSGL